MSTKWSDTAADASNAYTDPRRKLLANLQFAGLLNGESERQRQQKDLYAYPDITALASVAKTKETFHEILGSPSIKPHPSPISTALPTPVSSHSSPGTTVSSVLYPLIDDVLDLSAFDHLDHLPSPEHLPPPNRSTDPERADFLWNLAGYGTPRVKPMEAIEVDIDSSHKSGVYVLQSPESRGKFKSIFKPLDEEVFERRGIEVGMGAIREEAVYIIDRLAGGQAHVPVTARASVEEGGTRKKGSLQEFVEDSRGPVENFGIPKNLQEATQVVGLNEAQAVACLDLRVFNTDRHSGNLLLVGKKPYRIACIDHGCVLPAWWALDMASFDAWIDWPHVRAPPTSATVALVREVVDTLPSVVSELSKLELPAQAVWTLRICTALLEHGVLTHSLSLRALALLMTRSDLAEPSWLERRIAEACVAAGVAGNFVPEGKYGDLVFSVDKKVTRLFDNTTRPAAEVKYFKSFEFAFFSNLTDGFSGQGLRDAALAVEGTLSRQVG